MQKPGSTAGGYLLTAIVLFSATGVAIQSRRAIKYDLTPGQAAVAADHWPEQCGLRRTPGRATLVMAVHPDCPCSRASLAELDVLMSRYQDKVDAYVLFVRPAGFTQPWATTDLWHDAELTGVTRVADDANQAVKVFGARTSGQVFLYDAGARLRFKGGITGSRGHEGDNDGLSAIESFLETGANRIQETPVYGCEL